MESSAPITEQPGCCVMLNGDAVANPSYLGIFSDFESGRSASLAWRA